ncbi:MAG TPA: acetylornithine transaminase [Candidatus Omnitrophota bacterium]|nr:acetylornithine transaminase [Candidatus Omnitrophota bacterium]HPS20696.1 acetylornithine transaminase [Candidatus Omnitrophota bacterium]
MKKKTDLNDVKKMYDKCIAPSYARKDLCITKGKGAVVKDIDGKKYLDFFPGWAVSGIGHTHPTVVKMVNAQMKKILHVSNNFYNELQPLLAEKIIENSFSGTIFFGNSGAEANEAAIKIARKYGSASGRYEIITMEKSFHGRTLATLTATGQDKVKTGFSPLPEGFKYVPFNDINALKAAISDKTIAIMLEPVQGEGGINVADKAYIEEISRVCKERDMLLIFDEVQTGMGRTGKMFAFQNYGITPDVITLAKTLGGGFPIGAMVSGERLRGIFSAGSHGSTFGGSPVVCAAALGVFEVIEKEKLLKSAVKMGAYLVKKLSDIKKKLPIVKEIKGIGLMIGVELAMDDAAVVADKCMAEGLLINCTQHNIIRLLPPLNIKKAEVDAAMKIFAKVLEEVS